jgi:cell pole-organizing protein PopZ
MNHQREEGMKDRRSLMEGLNNDGEVDRSVEEQFVFASKKADPTTHPSTSTAASQAGEAKTQVSNVSGRVPLTTRVRSDFATALKRASLQRQLDGISPNTLQDILEEALEPWLRSNGYLG